MAINVPIITTFDAKGISKAIRDFQKLEGTALKTGFALASLDKGATAVATALAKVGLVAGGIGAIAVREFATFDQAMTESTAIMGDLSDEMRTNMEQAAREMGKTSLFSATQAAQAYFYLASAGMDASASIQALPVVTQFAQAGMFNLEQATSLLADAQSALGLTIRNDAVANMENMARVADVLVKGNIMANASVEQLSQSLTNKAASAMKAVGMSIEEGVAVLSAFADQGIKGDEAGTRFAIVLRELQRRALENRKAFDAFNVTVFDSQGEMVNMADIVGDLEDALRGQSDETKKTILSMMGFAEESVTVLLSLIGTSDQIRKYQAGLEDAGGITKEVADKQLSSLSGQLQLAKQRLQDVAIELGEKLAPTVIKIADSISEFARRLGEQGLGGAFEFLAGKIASFFSNLGALGKIVFTVIGAFTALRVAMTLYNGAMALGQIAVTTFGASLSAVSGIALGFAGTFTAIIASAGLIYSIYAKRKQEAEQVTRGFTDALKLEGQAQNEALIALANNSDKSRKFLESLEDLGMEFSDVSEFVKTGTGRLADLATTFDEVTRSVDGIYPEMAALYEAITGNTLAGDDLNAKYRNMTDEQRLLVSQMRDYLFPELMNLREAELKLASSSQLVAGLLGNVGASAQRAGDLIAYNTQRFSELARIYRERLPNPFGSLNLNFDEPVRSFGGAVRSAQDLLNDYIQAIRNWERQTISVEDAQKALTDAQNAQIDATQEVADAQKYYNQVLNGFAMTSKEVIDAQERMADAQIRYRDAQLRTRDAQEALIDAQERYQALFEPASARSLQEATDNVTEAQFRLADAQKELERLERRRLPNQRLLAEAQIAVREATWQLADAQAELTDLQDGPSDEELADAKRDIEDATRNLSDAQRSELEALQELNEAQEDLNELINGATEGSDRYREAVERLEQAKRREADAIDNVARALRNQRDALYELREAEASMGEARSEVRGDPLQADIQAWERTGIMSPALRQAFDAVDWEGLGNLMRAPGRANGGAVMSAQPYVVGERGPELFVPRQSGTIVPNHALGAQTNIYVNVQGSVTSEGDLIESIRKGLLNAQRSGRTLILS